MNWRQLYSDVRLHVSRDYERQSFLRHIAALRELNEQIERRAALLDVLVSDVAHTLDEVMTCTRCHECGLNGFPFCIQHALTLGDLLGDRIIVQRVAYPVEPEGDEE